MNFQAKRDYSNYKNQYQKVVSYLLDIQVHYPDLYEVLLRAPQFEYEVEACRYRKRFARRYLSGLVNRVKTHQDEKNLIADNLIWTYNEHRGALATLNYLDR
ncbi:MAG: hypothetical protein C0490_03425 [Marivirga sp.]|nr:hypothetical protein [Marivirga sp.]